MPEPPFTFTDPPKGVHPQCVQTHSTNATLVAAQEKNNDVNSVLEFGDCPTRVKNLKSI
jgi:hypothetical protein